MCKPIVSNTLSNSNWEYFLHRHLNDAQCSMPKKKSALSLSLSLNLCKFKKKYWLNSLRTPHHVVTLDKFIYIYMQSLFDVNVEPFCIFTNTFTESTHTWNHWWFEMCATFFFYLYLIRPFIVYNYIFGINNKFNGISYFFFVILWCLFKENNRWMTKCFHFKSINSYSE